VQPKWFVSACLVNSVTVEMISERVNVGTNNPGHIYAAELSDKIPRGQAAVRYVCTHPNRPQYILSIYFIV